MAQGVASYDWASTPIGAAPGWPRSLKTATDIMLSSRQPMFIAWGADLTFLYNDAYAEILGDKHPALGKPMHQVWWDIWDDIKPLIDRALSGDATWFENLPLTMNRRGFTEDTWWTLSYSPVGDDDERIGGMFCSCIETTAQVVAEAPIRRRADGLVRTLPRPDRDRHDGWSSQVDQPGVVARARSL